MRNGTDVTFSWDFGDGSRIEDSGPTQMHRYENPPKGDSYQVVVAAKNRAGERRATARVYVQVRLRGILLHVTVLQ